MKQKKELEFWKAIFGSSFVLVFLLIFGIQIDWTKAQVSNNNPNSDANIRIAISSLEDGHVHALALRDQSINEMISSLENDQDYFRLQSSTEFSGSVQGGFVHSHFVDLSRPQLQSLRDQGSLIVQSSINFGHRHNFRFLTQGECPGGAQPIPSASPVSSSGSATLPLPSPIPTGPYISCAGKSCGDTCTLCRPSDPTCVETAVVKECTLSGRCEPAPAVCSLAQ